MKSSKKKNGLVDKRGKKKQFSLDSELTPGHNKTHGLLGLTYIWPHCICCVNTIVSDASQTTQKSRNVKPLFHNKGFKICLLSAALKDYSR